MDLTEDEKLRELVHSSKYRTKDPEHLLAKLNRKERERIEGADREKITEGNLLSEVHDLAGVRLLHLHTSQMAEIHPAIKAVAKRENYELAEEPVVFIWDTESEEFFRRVGITARTRPEMYTSVHYVLAPPNRPEMRIELQVRTLMEEVWGEVSHTIDYPEPTTSLACNEQLKVLARIASGCTRLVDSIFRSDAEHKNMQVTARPDENPGN